MARENYSYKKFQRELAQKKKREEKLQRKQAKKDIQDKAGLPQVDAAGDIPAGEPQSPGRDI